MKDTDRSTQNWHFHNLTIEKLQTIVNNTVCSIVTHLHSSNDYPIFLSRRENGCHYISILVVPNFNIFCTEIKLEKMILIISISVTTVVKV